MNEMLLRGCMLKNTGFVLGLVVYTGRETRIQRNAAKTPNKIGEGIPLLLPRWHIIMLIKLAPDNCCPLWFLCMYLFYVQLPGDPVCKLLVFVVPLCVAASTAHAESGCCALQAPSTAFSICRSALSSAFSYVCACSALWAATSGANTWAMTATTWP